MQYPQAPNTLTKLFDTYLEGHLLVFVQASGLNVLRQYEAQCRFCFIANKEDLPRYTRTTAIESHHERAENAKTVDA